jgi:hypothetical protein
MEDLPVNRIEELGPDYFEALALKETYDSSESAYVRRENTYHGLPNDLTVEEIYSLADQIAVVLEGREQRSAIISAQARAINWLRATSLHNHDLRTAENVDALVESNPHLRVKHRAVRFRLPGNLFRSA